MSDLPGEMTKQILSAPPQDHALDEVLADRARPLGVAVAPAADRQQFLRKRQRLDAAAGACGWNDAPHRFTPPFGRAAAHALRLAAAGRFENGFELAGAPRGGVAVERPLARRPGDAQRSSSGIASASSTSLASCATRISLPGSKKCSSPPSSRSRWGVPQAAASNSRPDGQ